MSTATQPSVNLGVTLSDLQVSDLFFNYVPSTMGTERAEVRSQAAGFADLIGEGNNQDYIDTLTQNFLDRV